MEHTPKPLQLKRRGNDDHKLITVRITSTTLEKLDKLAADANRSRNEIINVILDYGVDNITLT